MSKFKKIFLWILGISFISFTVTYEVIQFQRLEKIEKNLNIIYSSITNNSDKYDENTTQGMIILLSKQLEEIGESVDEIQYDVATIESDISSIRIKLLYR